MTMPKPDPSLIRYDIAGIGSYAGWTMTFQSPDQPKVACFVAAQHGGHKPTIKAISRAFDQFKPDAVIVESMPNRGEESPPWFADIARKAKGNVENETFHAVNLALDHKIPFVTGEPTPAHVHKTLRESGYGLNDFIAWDISRNIYAEKRHDRLTENNLNERIDALADRSVKSLGLRDKTFTSKDYASWFQKNLGRTFSLANMQDADDHPLNGPNAHFLQRLITTADQARETHILATINYQLGKHDRLLVVYGEGHLRKLEPALEKMVGAADVIAPPGSSSTLAGPITDPCFSRS